MRTRFPIILAMTAAMSVSWITALAGGPEPIATDSDLGRLQGRWTGRAGARKQIQVVLTVRGRRVDAAITAPQGIRLDAQGEVKVDETTSPRKVDWVNFSGADQQEFPPIAGIYKLDGDTLTVCNGGMNGSRPKEFKSGDGVLAEVVVFQREPESTAAADKSSSQRSR
jgi:uncharacterized protein (TIGR03067 family)